MPSVTLHRIKELIKIAGTQKVKNLQLFINVLDNF